MNLKTETKPERILWQQVQYGHEYWVGKKTLRPLEKRNKNGHMVSSLCHNGMHMPALDIDFRIEYFEKERALAFWKKITKDNYLNLLQTMTFCEIVLEDYFHRSFKALESVGLKEHLKEPWTIYEMPNFVKVIPSTTNGHFHLFIDKPMMWAEYKRLLTALRDAEIIGSNFFNLSIKEQKSFLFLPGQKEKIKFIYTPPL